jgi:diguanylate cyclase (GGDEF)-like protein
MVAWLVVGGYGGAFTRAPRPSWSLAVRSWRWPLVRCVHRPPREADAARACTGCIACGAGHAQRGAMGRGVLLVHARPGFESVARRLHAVHARPRHRLRAHLRVPLGWAALASPCCTCRAAGAVGRYRRPGDRAGHHRLPDLRLPVAAARALPTTSTGWTSTRTCATSATCSRARAASTRSPSCPTAATSPKRWRARRAGAPAGQPLSLLLLDIDHFKTINDQHGHAVGDGCLAAVASRLQLAFAHPGELAARIGGEEFGVVLEGLDGAPRRRAPKVSAKRWPPSPLLVDGKALPVTISIGWAEYEPARNAAIDGFFRAADRALYRAKREGRNRVCSDLPAPPAAPEAVIESRMAP